MIVEEYMTTTPRAVNVDECVHRAADLMWHGDFGVVPVVDADNRVVAMLTDRDICMAALTQAQPLREIPVRTAMSRRLFAVHPSDTVAHAEGLMRDHQLRRLPVVDAVGRLVGVVSLADLVRTASITTGTDGLSPRAITQTLGRIIERPRDTIAARVKHAVEHRQKDDSAAHGGKRKNNGPHASA
jgi:CBS domain-containing protein